MRAISLFFFSVWLFFFFKLKESWDSGKCSCKGKSFFFYCRFFAYFFRPLWFPPYIFAPFISMVEGGRKEFILFYFHTIRKTRETRNIRWIFKVKKIKEETYDIENPVILSLPSFSVIYTPFNLLEKKNWIKIDCLKSNKITCWT